MASSLFAAEPDSLDYGTLRTTCDFVQALVKLQRAAQFITSTLDLDQLLERVVHDIAVSLGCVQVFVWLRDPDTEDMVLHGISTSSKYHRGARRAIGREGIVGRVAVTGAMYYAPDVRLDPYYLPCEPSARSSVSLPLLVGNNVVGVLCVDHAKVNAFSDDQIVVFEALAGYIAVAIENARRFREERAEREILQREADDARAVQQSLLLKAVPLVPGFAFETAWHPAGTLAGDWFDFIDLGGDRYGIVLADVSGKGMPAALLMSATRALLRSIVLLDPAPGRTLAQLNRTLSEDFPTGKFVTMIYAVLDARAREITLASAGHLQPLLINGECRFLNVETGLPLGLGASTYPELKVPLSPGTKLLLYTDGITEAMNQADDEFGADRLLAHFQQPGACVNGLIEKVREYGTSTTHTDDATAVLIRSRPNPPAHSCQDLNL